MALRDRITEPKLVRLYDYWQAKRNGRSYPSRADIDPTEMTFVLGNIDLVEISGDPIVFTFRLSGSNIDRNEGFNMQGKTLDEYPLPEHRDTIRRTYLDALSSGEPHYELLDRISDDKLQRYARLILPLSRDGQAIDMFLIGRIEMMDGG
ncbi:MAG: PAS domain-containing protein [Dongiaceae bacterium]